METGREAVRRRNGLGFAAGDYWDFDAYNDYGNNWDWWFGGGGGDSYNDFDFPIYEAENNWPSFGPIGLPDLNPPPISASGNDDRYWFDWGQYLSDWFSGNVLSIDSYAQGNQGKTPYGSGGESFGFPDWLPGPGPAAMDPQYGPAGDAPLLPGYCPKGTYHPVNDPYACVPFPADNQDAKKRAQQQQKAQQAAANAAKKAQQAQDKQCPKDPQGRPVWRNPATGKCELAPVCSQGQKFDSTTKRCLTAAQVKEIYGDNNWLIWLLIAGGALVILNNSGGSSSGGRRR